MGSGTGGNGRLAALAPALWTEKALTQEKPGGDDSRSDADSWVAQWSSLFGDEREPTGQPPTEEMPVYQPEQPPVSKPEAAPRVFPGHHGPTPPAKPGPGREAGDAAEIAAWQKSQERSKRRAKLRANQRKAREIQRQRPSSTQIRIAEPVTARSWTRDRPDRRAAIITGGLVVAAVLAVVGFLLTGFDLGSESGEQAAVNLGRANAGDGPNLNLGADVGPKDIEELALSTVQLVGLDDQLEPECAGSGVIVRSDGTILTNAHVVTTGPNCQFTSIGVALTLDSTSAAELKYRAVVLSVDPVTDLAVLRIDGLLDQQSENELPDTFPAAPLGDSATVDLGDTVRILGYPVMGGETITLTTGSVSGFTAQAGLGTRALIKTDATISAGNSGGMAVDSSGRVIGIPTKARASESGPAIDCRPLADTNSDGEVDDEDNCVPVGGFLNGVRPINLALALLGTAANAEPIGPVVSPPQPSPDFDFDRVMVANPRFALGRDGNAPVDEVVTAKAGISELCFFVDWSGIPVGSNWDGAWFVDGELQPNLGFTDQIWNIEEDGQNFWLCAQEQNALGLPAGIYEIGFFLEGTLLFAEGIELTPEPVEVVTVTWSNDTDGEICALAVNPFSDSGQVGLNELASGDAIPPGESRTMELPVGTVVVEAYNCADEPVADAFEGLDISGPATFLIGL